jgi:cytochrome P450
MAVQAKQAPGPKGLPILGNALAMRGVDPLAFWQDIHQTYGDTAKLKLGPVDAWFFASPEVIHQVLVSQHGIMRKGFAYSGLKMLLGEGLITTDKDHWSSERRRLNPVFSPATVENFASSILDACAAGLRELEGIQGRPVDIGHAMTRLTMRVISRTAFGVDLGEGHDEVVDSFDFAFAFVADITAQPVRPPLFVPTARNRRYRKAYGIIEDFTTDLIDKSLARPHASAMSGRIFGALEGIDRKLLRDEVISLYFAGFETTARTMTFMMYLLARYPEVAETLRQEAQAAGDYGGSAPFAKRLPVATEVVSETLRLYPPVAMLARQPASECEIGGYRVHANDLIILCPYLAQRNKSFWPDGDRFRPDPANPLAQRLSHRGAYAPFGAGPRICLGKHFAMAEMAIAISMIARDFDWRIENPEPLGLSFHGTLRPSEPIIATLAHRDSH